jgi:hypothetical protein
MSPNVTAPLLLILAGYDGAFFLQPDAPTVNVAF